MRNQIKTQSEKVRSQKQNQLNDKSSCNGIKKILHKYNEFLKLKF